MVGTVTYLRSKLEPEGTAPDLLPVTTCLKRLGFCNNVAFASAKKFGVIYITKHVLDKTFLFTD